MTPSDLDFPVAKPMLALGALALALIAGVGYVQRQVSAAKAEAKVQKEVARAALERETQAKAQAGEWQRRAETIQQRLDSLPPDPGPRPVPPSAPLPVVVDGLRGLGIAPLLLGDNLGLSLGDARTTLNWGLEAQRVGPLAARLEASTAMAQALHLQASSLQLALGACDDRAAAEQRRADALDRALKAQGSPRNWTAGVLIDQERRLGAYVSWSYKAVDLHAVFINNSAALGAGYRF